MELARKYNSVFINLIRHLNANLTQPIFTELKISHEGKVLNTYETVKMIESGLDDKAFFEIEFLINANDIKSLLAGSKLGRELVIFYNNPEKLYYYDLAIKAGICQPVIKSFYSGKNILEYLKNINKYCQDLENDKLEMKEASFIIASIIAGNVFEFEKIND